MKRKFLIMTLGLAFCLMVFKSDASASITMRWDMDGYNAGWAMMGDWTGYIGGVAKTNTEAGQYTMDILGGPTVPNFCIDPTQAQDWNYSSYNLQVITDPYQRSAIWLADSYVKGTLNTLYSGQFTTQAQLAAATQTAIWELFTDPTSLDVDAGITRLTVSTSYASLAQTLVNDAYDEHAAFDTSGWRMAIALGAGYQDVIVPIPVPAAAWLLGSGLLGLVAIRRYRK